jgi:RHS repeat-associated protein
MVMRAPWHSFWFQLGSHVVEPHGNHDATGSDVLGTVIASSAINNRYSYTGREWDATVGLYHFRARWMSPKTGRFLGSDPIGYEVSEGGLYEFIDGMPLTESDPMGLVKSGVHKGFCDSVHGTIGVRYNFCT